MRKITMDLNPGVKFGETARLLLRYGGRGQTSKSMQRGQRMLLKRRRVKKPEWR